MTKLYLNKFFHYSLTLFTMEAKKKCEVSEIITESILPAYMVVRLGLHFPIGILGLVWCLIVSIPDICPLSYFYTHCQYIVTAY